MIRDNNATTNPKEFAHANGVDANLANLIKSREFAVEKQAQGKDMSVLIAWYDEQIARMKAIR